MPFFHLVLSDFKEPILLDSEQTLLQNLKTTFSEMSENYISSFLTRYILSYWTNLNEKPQSKRLEEQEFTVPLKDLKIIGEKIHGNQLIR